MARVRKELEAELLSRMTDERQRPDASIVPLFEQQGTASQPRPGESDVQALRRMLADLENRLVVAEQRTLERIEDLERNLESMETRIARTGDEAVDRARTLERSMVKLADRLRALEPR